MSAKKKLKKARQIGRKLKKVEVENQVRISLSVCCEAGR